MTGIAPRRLRHRLAVMALAIASGPTVVALDWHFSARALQQEADSYALALATMADEGRLPPRIEARPGISIAFASPPTQGAFAGRAGAVRVEARRLWSPPLPALFGGTRAMAASATAADLRSEGASKSRIQRVE